MTVVAAVIERSGRILIGQRRPVDPHPLKWEFPGGKVATGETPQSALTRELLEELAIEVIIGNEIARYHYQYPGLSPMELIFCRINSFTGEPRNLAFERIVWEEPSRLSEYDFLEADAAFVLDLSQIG